MKKLIVATLVLFCVSDIRAESSERYLKKFKLTTGETIVVAEGDYEARSIGSFSIRVYEATSENDETTFFLSGLIHSRDGTVDNVLIEDVNDDSQPEIIVVSRSAGTGNYLSAYVFEYSDDNLVFRMSKVGMPPDSKVLRILKNELNKK